MSDDQVIRKDAPSVPLRKDVPEIEPNKWPEPEPEEPEKPPEDDE